MYFYPKLDEKKYPYSSKLISKIYNKNFFFKPDYQDLKISKEIIDYYHQLKQKYLSKSEWTWINKTKRSNFINSLINKDTRKTSELLANCFKNNTSYGIISWHWSKLNNPKNKKNFISSLMKDYLTWSEFTKVNKTDEKYLNTKNKFGNFYGLKVNKNQIMIDTLRHDYYANKILNLFKDIKKKNRILVEIGGGYGGLCFQLLKRNFNDIYINIDILETLLINYYFLRKYTKKNIIICDLASINNFNPKNLYLGTTNYFKDLNTKIDLVFNSNSFSEMSKKDIWYYFKFIEAYKSKYIYHQNSNILLFPNSTRHIETISKDFPINKHKYKLLSHNISLWGSGSGRYREYLYEKF